MLRLEVRKYLYDVQQACGHIEQFTAGKTLADYASDALVRSGVERQFEIVGEALNQILRIDPDLGRSISDPARRSRNQTFYRELCQFLKKRIARMETLENLSKTNSRNSYLIRGHSR